METEVSLSLKQPLEGEECSSVLHGNDVFLNKLLSRNSLSIEQYCLPRPSEAYNCKLPGTVPFKWEVQPGIPKDPPNEEKDPSSSMPLESSLRFKKDLSLKSNHHQNQIIKKRSSLKGPSSCFLRRSKKTLKKSPVFPHHSGSSNSDDHRDGFFSSSSCASKSSSSTSATTESPFSNKVLITSPSPPMSSKFRCFAKWLFRRLF